MRTITLILLGLAFVAAGCSSTTQGVVNLRTELSAGSTAPDITFRSPEGKETSLLRERLPITIVAFVTPSGPDCSKLEPKLAGITGQFAHLPVSVVQVSEPTAQFPHGPGCVLVSGPGRRNVMAICDPDRLRPPAGGGRRAARRAGAHCEMV
jgi:hypothetical protein